MSFKRNLLIVLAHGLRSDAVGPTPMWPIGTPNIDKLTQRGLRLVATSACPSNWGGMISALTGLHPRQHGHISDTQQSPHCKGVPALLRAAGYHVAGVGCVGAIEQHLDQATVIAPTTQTSPTRCCYMNFAAGKGLKESLIQQRRQRERFGPFEADRLLLEPDDDIDGFIGLKANEMLSQLPTGKPWAMFVVFSGPGNDLPPPPMYADIVPAVDLQTDFIPADFRQLNVLGEMDYPRVMLQRLEAHAIGRIRADYLGRVSLVDFCVGQFQRQIENRHDFERVWTIMTSDHGHLLGEHGLVGHRSFLAPAVEVPLVVAPPTAAKCVAADWLCSTVDAPATVAALAGCDLPRWVSGRNLMGLFRNGTFDGVTHRVGCLSEFSNRLMLETERYKIIFNTDSHRVLGIYDLLEDGEEKCNLLETPKARGLADALKWRVGDALLSLRAVPGNGNI